MMNEGDKRVKIRVIEVPLYEDLYQSGDLFNALAQTSRAFFVELNGKSTGPKAWPTTSLPKLAN